MQHWTMGYPEIREYRHLIALESSTAMTCIVSDLTHLDVQTGGGGAHDRYEPTVSARGLSGSHLLQYMSHEQLSCIYSPPNHKSSDRYSYDIDRSGTSGL